ncbi:probable membrane-associated kinase regulator 2 isoform X2 [Pyrus x bretschneideri]|uniref:probable membrane-associated kinase regulator 2 isoform X2 n=1 Tax=Pyrus x bretschneideri TaxID=225117 RepID=UPI002030BA57|nr:probable membrane-associated kinase regulator 2 isoform X2 [Pyrus x bretschneideri]
MEAFSLLKYWRGGGAVYGTPLPNCPDTPDSAKMRTPTTTSPTTTILTAVAQNDDEDTDDDDGPFFDLEFAVPDEDEAAAAQTYQPCGNGDCTDDSDEEARLEDDDGDDESDDCEDGEGEFNFTVSSGSSQDRTDDPNLTLSPSDDLFFKGKLVPIEPSSIEFNPSEESNSKPQFAGSLLKSATKFRVFMLGLKKSKSNSNASEKPEKTEPPAVESVAAVAKEAPQKTQEKPLEEEPPQKQKQQGKLFTVKFKVEEVPIVSLFTRDNSSRISTAKKSQTTQEKPPPVSASEESASEEKRFSKEVMQKYLKMVKPLYVRVSKRYGEKLRLSGQLSLNGSTAAASNPAAVAEKTQPEAEVSEPPPATASNAKSGQKQGNIPAGLRVVCKHLGKSRSASSAVAAAPSGAVVAQRRDDSLLQQQDGIQSAILHCKRSFNASRVSDPSNEKKVS